MVWMIVFIVLCLLFGRAYRNTFDAAITHIPVAVNESERVKINKFAPIRILHLSDLHMENLSIQADRVLAEMRYEPIDLIAITGDLLDREVNIPKAIAYVEKIMSLHPPLGTFVVFGNHDYVLAPNKLAQLKSGLERIGCQVLCNSTITLDVNGQKLHVIGVDDYSTRHSNLAKAYKEVDAEGLRLVLTHDPNVVLEMRDYDYDYLLSGHFHGGQIHWPKPYHLAKMGKLPKMNMVKGLHYQDGRPFYISEGLGQTGVNIRLRSRPEITLHTLLPHTFADLSAEAALSVKEAASALAVK